MTITLNELDQIPLQACYRQLHEAVNTTYVPQPDGTTNIIIDDHWHFDRMGIVDEFVRDALASTGPAFVLERSPSGTERYRPQDLAATYRSVTGTIDPGLRERFNVRNVFVQLFVDACDDLQILTWAGHVAAHGGSSARATAECFNELVEVIRAKAKQQPYASRIYHTTADPARNFEKAKEHLYKLLEKRSRYMALRLDLGYEKECSFDVFNRHAKADMKRLLDNRRHNRRLFGDLAGYIWKIEYGTDRLLHFHVILFFSKKNPSKHVYWAQEVGRYWRDVITRGLGTFHSCNQDLAKYRHCGIGEITRGDTEKIDNLVRAMAYLFKADQCLPVRVSEPRLRTFGKSQIPGSRRQKASRTFGNTAAREVVGAIIDEFDSAA